MLQIGSLIVIQRILMAMIVLLLLHLLRLVGIHRSLLKVFYYVA
jgi:hypothetical protein